VFLKPTRLFLVAAGIIALIFALNALDLTPLLPPGRSPGSPPQPSVTPTPASPNSLTINNRSYQYYYRQVDTYNETLDLIPNFSASSTSSEIIKQHECIYGINGGFYLPTNSPLGLFQVGSQKLGQTSKSPTFNGFLSKSKHGDLLISSNPSPSPPNQPLQFIFQSGPFYSLASSAKMHFADTKNARRHLIAQDKNSVSYLFSVFGAESAFNGPTLDEIYDFFTHPSIQNIAPFTAILNLDGGSASAFYDQNQSIKVEELKPVGSFLCGQLKSSN
jgi:hypothetical protein